MSDLADAVFGGQLMGHVIAGEELTQSVVVDAARNASIAGDIALSDDSLSKTEQQIIEARVAQKVADGESYSISDAMSDNLQAELDASLADGLL